MNINIVLTSTPRSYKRFLSLTFPHRNLVCIYLLLMRATYCILSFPSLTLWFDHRNRLIYLQHEFICAIILDTSPRCRHFLFTNSHFLPFQHCMGIPVMKWPFWYDLWRIGLTNAADTGKVFGFLLVLLMPIFLFSLRNSQLNIVPCTRSNFVAQNSYVLSCSHFTFSFLLYKTLYLNNIKVNNRLRFQYVCCFSIK